MSGAGGADVGVGSMQRMTDPYEAAERARREKAMYEETAKAEPGHEWDDVRDTTPAEVAIVDLEKAVAILGEIGGNYERRLKPLLTPNWGEMEENVPRGELTAVARETSPLVEQINTVRRRLTIETDRLSKMLRFLEV